MDGIADGDGVLPGRDAGDPVGNVHGDATGGLALDVEFHPDPDAQRPSFYSWVHPYTLEPLPFFLPDDEDDDERGIRGGTVALPVADDDAGELRGQNQVVARRGLRVGNGDAGYLPPARNGEVVPDGADAYLDAASDTDDEVSQ